MLSRAPARPEARVVLLVGYLLVGAVALRSVDNFSLAETRGWLVIALLALYLAVLTVDQFLPLPLKGHPYFALQSGIVAAAMLLAPRLDFYACLFFPLSTQALLYFRRREGFAWIIVFTVIFMSILAWYHGLSMAVFYGVASVFFASYGALLAQTIAAHRQLEEYAARVEDLTLSQERQRLARELHDTLAQGLAGLILQLEAVDSHLARGGVARAQTIVNQAMTRARLTLADARLAIADLRAGDSDLADLGPAIREEVERFTSATGLTCALNLPQLPVLPDPLRQCVFRTITESLTNITRHARAQRVWVQAAHVDGELEVSIRDDGLGFDPLAAVEQAGHYGLIGLRERARLAGGSLDVTSAPGQGTTVRLRLPLAEPVHG